MNKLIIRHYQISFKSKKTIVRILCLIFSVLEIHFHKTWLIEECPLPYNACTTVKLLREHDIRLLHNERALFNPITACSNALG